MMRGLTQHKADRFFALLFGTIAIVCIIGLAYVRKIEPRECERPHAGEAPPWAKPWCTVAACDNRPYWCDDHRIEPRYQSRAEQKQGVVR